MTHLKSCKTCGWYGLPPNLNGWYGYCNNGIMRELSENEIKIHEQMGCASYIPTLNQNGIIHCYRCGDHCTWEGYEDKTYPRLLDFNGIPSCPSDSPMPKEFRDDGP